MHRIGNITAQANLWNLCMDPPCSASPHPALVPVPRNRGRSRATMKRAAMTRACCLIPSTSASLLRWRWKEVKIRNAEDENLALGTKLGIVLPLVASVERELVNWVGELPLRP